MTKGDRYFANRYASPASLISATEHWLLAAPQRSMIHGPLLTRLDSPDLSSEWTLLTLTNAAGEIASVISIGPQRGLCLTNADEQGLDAIVSALTGIQIQKVLAPAPLARKFAHLWARAAECHKSLKFEMQFWQCKCVLPPRCCRGEMRLATINDVELLAGWRIKYGKEALQEDESAEQATESIAQMIQRERVYLWEDSKPVSSIAWGRETPNAVHLYFVFTPIELRQRGYASNLTASLTKLFLTLRSKSHCLLFTDKRNSISAWMYQQIGYELIDDWAEWCFDYSGQVDHV